MLRIKMLLLLVVLAAGMCEVSATTTTITYVAGNCKPKLPSFPTISAALAASPAPDVVMVCPGTYNEQVEITLPVTLEGITSGDSSGAVIAPPAGGLMVNATTSFGEQIAAQLWVNNAAGPVTISNLTVDGGGNTPSASTVGVFTQNSATIVDRVTTRNQTGFFASIGVFAEGGASVPSVTIENSSIHDFNDSGIRIQTNSPDAAINVVLKNNRIEPKNGGAVGISIFSAATVTVSGNTLMGPGAVSFGTTGIVITNDPNSTGSVSGNTIQNFTTGMVAEASAVSVLSNNIANSVDSSVILFGPVIVQGNTITGGQVGINFLCTADPNVRSNSINDVSVGIDRVPDTTVISNSYFNVPTIRQGGC